ncbi:TolC family protein [Peijinzhouia sedimentorum]
MLKRILSVALILLSYSAYSQTNTKVWTLAEAVEYAKEQNLQIQNAQLNVESAQIGFSQAKANLLPNITSGASSGYRFGRSIDPTTNLFVDTKVGTVNFQAGSNVTLFQGRQLANNIKQTQSSLQASQYNLQDSEFNVAVNVASQYLNVLFAKAQLENAELQVSITSEQLERTKRLVAAGAAPLANQLDIEAQFASDELAVVTAENQVAISTLALKQSLLLPVGEPFEIEEPDIDIEALQFSLADPEVIYNISSATQPSIKAAEMNLLAAEYGVKSAKGAHLPTISVGFSAFTNYSDIRDEIFRPDGTFQTVSTPVGYVGSTGETVFRDQQVAGGETQAYTAAGQFKDNLSQSLNLQVSIPIFNRFSVRNNVSRAKIEKRRAEVQTSQAKQTLRQTIETAYTDALAASKSYQANTRRLSSLEEAFRAAESRFNQGAANAVDYQVASNNLIRARIDLLRAKYELIFRTKVLDFYMGKPLSLN